MTDVPPYPPARPAKRLFHKSFSGLLVTQFLGAFNDNMFRWFAVPVAQPLLGDAQALSLGLACFTLPYLLLATAAGFLADRFSKRSVIVGCKIAEIVIMALGIGAVLAGNLTMLFAVVALMGAQSALFGPAKFGSIPEMVKTEALSAANGWMGLITVGASALGASAGLALYAFIKPELGTSVTLAQIAPAAAAFLGVALLGWGFSLLIHRLPAADPTRPPVLNPLAETFRDLKLLASDRAILRTVLGIAFFWSLASLAQMNIDLFGDNVLGLTKDKIGPLLAILVAGMGLGSVLAGIWSGGKVELGIVPLGAAGIVVSSLLVFATGESVDPLDAASSHSAYFWSCAWLFTLGISAGLFNIPLEAYLQHRSSVQTRGTILATSNFVSFSFILGAAGLFWLMQSVLGMSANTIFLVTGLGTIPVGIYIFCLLPDATLRFSAWLATHTIYRVRVYGRENLPETGGALLVANHISWLDGLLLLLTSSRPIRMLAYADYANKPGLRWLSKLYAVIPIKASDGPKSVIRSLQTAREAVINGELVCIFAEGQISRTGQLQPFQRGLMRIVKETGQPIIPVYLDELWGSIFSFSGGRFFWKWPRRWPYPVSIFYGKPMLDPDSVDQVRNAVQDLGVEAVQQRKHRDLIPQRLFLRKCRTSLFRPKVADSGGAELTGGKLLAGTLIMHKLLEQHVLAPDERMVGLLLPPSVGGVVANTAVSLSGRVAVNLNYTLSNHDVNYCIKQAGITHVLTSRRFIEKRPFDLDAEMIFLEDLREKNTLGIKLASLLKAFLLPVFLLERMYGLLKIKPEDLLTVVFTSGSTGEPKGVMLSHHNVSSNIVAVDQLFHITKQDVLLGVLPFFHSFGYTATLWLTVTLEPKGVYHFNPLDARTVGKLCEQHGVTILLATPTFLRSYLKRCTKEQMHRLDLAIVGAEKMPVDLATAFTEKFGVAPTEGYGTTELSPVAAFNVPEHRSELAGHVGTKLGSVGRVMPGASARIVDPDTGAVLGVNADGLLQIKGSNVMLGYLGNPEKTAEVIKDGWYDTGDIARIDEDGFIFITGRLSRFSKIGGEMVPHVKIEEILAGIFADGSDEEAAIQVAVTSVSDEKKGERLVVVHTPSAKSADQILKEFCQSGTPNLWIPSADSFLETPEIPVLGTGKLDLRGLKELALQAFTPAETES